MSVGDRTRRVQAPALAKINLDLRVLGKRADGFHELRTVFQTISLADMIEIAFTPGRKTAIELTDELGIQDNLVVRAARLAMEAMHASGRIEMKLFKRIPMGAGLGGGSSDAAAILLALPALVGKPLKLEKLMELAGALGSDVPFFLLGGTAVGIGRGTELFPLPDTAGRSATAVLIAPGVHIDTARAYADLSPRLTTESQQNKIFSFQSHTWNPLAGWPARNDFEEVVFERHSRLAALKKGLIRAGASIAMMTGSGSALFGLYPGREEASNALDRLAGPNGLREGERAFRVSLVNRARYRRIWSRALGEQHALNNPWPPLSRYAQ